MKVLLLLMLALAAVASAQNVDYNCQAPPSAVLGSCSVCYSDIMLDLMGSALWEVQHVLALQLMEQVRALHAILLMIITSTTAVPLACVSQQVLLVLPSTQMALVILAGGEHPMDMSALDPSISKPFNLFLYV